MRNVFLALDPAGVTHKRTSDARTYTNTVVVQHSKAAALASATSASNAAFDGREYDYEVAKAAGTHPNVTRVTPATGFHSSYSAEYVAEYQARQRAENASQIEKAKALVASVSREAFIANRLAERLARVEATDFSVWHNLGWQGRTDLARRLAASTPGAVILEAAAQ